MNASSLDDRGTAKAVASGARTSRPGAYRRWNVHALSIWALTGALTLYLGLNGGGFDLVVRNQVGIVVWWLVVVFAVAGVLPASRFTRGAWVALALFGAFVVWTGIASTWSHSSERSLEELSRVACYLGVLVLAVALHRERESAVRHTSGAIGAAVVAISVVALLARLRVVSFAGSTETAAFIPDAHGRLAWPLNYWNALGALMAVGVPLLLSIASTARGRVVQAAAAAAVPVIVLCGYLTFSRGGAIAAGAGMLVYFSLAADRIPKLGTGLICLAGAVAGIAAAARSPAIENGLSNATAQHQGRQLLLVVLVVCAVVALAQGGLGFAASRRARPRWLTVSRERARALLITAAAVVIVAALAGGAPSRLSTAWSSFKRSDSSALTRNAITRFGVVSGNGRYDFWKTAVNASGQHLVGGWGPGTFEFIWLSRAPSASYARNAHSLYFETLVEDGLIGLVVLVSFFLVVVLTALRVTIRASGEQRSRNAAALAACIAFLVSAAFDWIWQIPVLPVCFLLLSGALLAPEQATARIPGWRGIVALRVAPTAVAVACVGMIVVPLAETNALRQSQAAVNAGNPAKALNDARLSSQIEPGSASAQLQTALVLEQQGRRGAALVAARNATVDEPLNWDTWLVRSRLEAETGHPGASVAAYRRARSLNPWSPLFRVPPSNAS